MIRLVLEHENNTVDDEGILQVFSIHFFRIFENIVPIG